MNEVADEHARVDHVAALAQRRLQFFAEFNIGKRFAQKTARAALYGANGRFLVAARRHDYGDDRRVGRAHALDHFYAVNPRQVDVAKDDIVDIIGKVVEALLWVWRQLCAISYRPEHAVHHIEDGLVVVDDEYISVSH